MLSDSANKMGKLDVSKLSILHSGVHVNVFTLFMTYNTHPLTLHRNTVFECPSICENNVISASPNIFWKQYSILGLYLSKQQPVGDVL